MAQSSSSRSYDVFLSFRGEDTRSTFTGHLYTTLRNRGIKTFVDDEGFNEGEDITGSLMRGIQESRTAIIIFSQNYASSRWCLEELVMIMECRKNRGTQVWSIFYHVDPSDVRYQRGIYAEALASHEGNIKHKEKVEMWRSALQEATELSGWQIKQGGRSEYKLIWDVIEELSRKIDQDKVTITESKKESLRIETQAYSYSDILSITDNFETIIGEGGFGEVYLGTLHDDTRVAVKLLPSSSQQGHKEFQSQVELLMSIHHKNLVSLIGYCNEGDVKALIYEYVDNGDLHTKLSEKNPNALTWVERLGIAIDAAKGLKYLHKGCMPPIIHRDLKPSNILLNANMEAKIADFGISRAFANYDDTHIVTIGVGAGTDGYCDPLCQISEKSNVYTFGIILFELIMGKQEIQMHDWVIPEIKKGHIEKIIDPRLEGKFNIASVKKAIDVARQCISMKAARRPEIEDVLGELVRCLALEMENIDDHEMDMEFKVYSNSQILSITKNKKTKIGKGGFGDVYLGSLHDGAQVAVKLLSLSSKQGHKEFQSEVKLLTVIGHENLVSFKGYCNEGVVMALIYEYMENGDLKQKLSEKNNVLKWTERLQIAVDVAQGLYYLHNGCRPPIIHRDLKPANILLNAKMRAKIADFGISRAFANDNDTHLVTTRAGTDGYRDPLSRITKKSDVYSFGIILFELITGLSVNIKSYSGEVIHIRDWVIDEIKKGHIQNIIDPRLEGTFSEASAKNAIDVARPCISLKEAKRPDITHVLAGLKESLDLDITHDYGMGSLRE